MKKVPPFIPGSARPRRALVQALSIVIALLCVSSLQASAIDESGPQWRFLNQDTPYSIRYYEEEPAADVSQGLLRVWTKTIPTAEGNPQIREIKSLWELDCGQGAFRNLKTVIVYRDGSSEETATPREWTKVQPGVWVGRLAEIFCRKEPVAREKNDS